MRLTEPCLILLFLSLVSGNSTSSPLNLGSDNLERTPDYLNKSSDPTDNVPIAILEIPEDNDLDPDVTMDELLFFESLINEEKATEENRGPNTDTEEDGKDEIGGSTAASAESRAASDNFGLRRRQGEVNSELENEKHIPDVEYDDSKELTEKNPPPRFGQRSRRPYSRVRDGAPLLQLTQGGYQRPYEQPSVFRNRQVSRPDSSEQSEKVEEPDKSSNDGKQSTVRRIVPQVTYSNQQQRQQPYMLGPDYGPGPVLRPNFQVPSQNRVPGSHSVPSAIMNTQPPAAFLDYTPPSFRAQFPPSNEIGYASFNGDLGNSALYQSSPRNPYQNAALLFQNFPQMQSQPVFVDPTRNMQQQLQIDPARNRQQQLQLDQARNMQQQLQLDQARNMQPQLQLDPTRNMHQQLPPNSLPVYPNFDNSEDNVRGNFASYFNPNADSQFQVPANFYGANPNEVINAFNNPPINFLPNYPNPEARLPTQFFRYPTTAPGARNQQNVNQQNGNDQQPDSDTSQEDKKTQELESKEDNASINAGDPNSVPFGTRLQGQNEGDFYIRYPTNEAGYAVKENLPPQNGSEQEKDNTQRSLLDQRSFSSSDPYRNALNTVNNQRQNKTRNFIPEELFRDVPIDFGYQRPQNQIFVEYPEGNRDTPRYPTSDFDSRGPFNGMTPLSENSFPFLNSVNQRRGPQPLDEVVPSCAKQNNASFCFEDSEYPRSDIMYTINSNSYLMDRLSGPDNLQLDTVALIDSNSNSSYQVEENYACAVDTKFGTPLRARNLVGSWRVIINVEQFSQPVRMEVCRSAGDPCSYTDSKTKTSCEQKFSVQRLLTWSSEGGPVVDLFKIPVACACRILQAPPA